MAATPVTSSGATVVRITRSFGHRDWTEASRLHATKRLHNYEERTKIFKNFVLV